MDEMFTVGHSTHPIDDFMRMLTGAGVKAVADVRTIAKSRHNPQFCESALAQSLERGGFSYRRLAALGGLRHARAKSVNDGWRNPSFRGYADYMQTPQFSAGIDELMIMGSRQRTAVMCAEAVPWRCHRSLISDALIVRGVAVQDIISVTSVKASTLTSFARIEGTTITYPAADASLDAAGSPDTTSLPVTARGVTVRRIYDPPEQADGLRVLVDRLWPRGVSKQRAALGQWCKAVAPSPELRKWQGDDPLRFEEFRIRYLGELQQPGQARALDQLSDLALHGTLTLLTAQKHTEMSKAAVLAELLRDSAKKLSANPAAETAIGVR